MALLLWFAQRRGGAESIVLTLREAPSNNFGISFMPSYKLLNAIRAKRNCSAPPRLRANQNNKLVQS
jgi:hypothetical protein